MTQPGDVTGGAFGGSSLGPFPLDFPSRGDDVSGLGASAIAAVNEAMFQIERSFSFAFQENPRTPGQFFFDILSGLGRFIIPGVFPGAGAGPTDRPSGTGTLQLPPGLPPAPPGTLEDPGIIATATSEIITIPPARIRRFEIPNLLALPSGGAGDGMALPEFFGTGPGFDIGDIFDIGGRILGDVNVPFGGFNVGFGGEPLRVAATRANGANGGTQQVANGVCPPARARMPSSIMADDPCSPTNPTIYIKAGKASAALWPGVIRSQAKRLSTANKSIPKKVVRRKKK